MIDRTALCLCGHVLRLHIDDSGACRLRPCDCLQYEDDETATTKPIDDETKDVGDSPVDAWEKRKDLE